MPKYLDLDRQFMPFQDEHDWEAKYQSLLADDFFGCERWPELLTHKRTVILAEAGAGKTEEMRERAKALREKGVLAFYLTVNELSAGNSFRGALALPDDETRFDEWLESNQEGVFLVDSVDEARLSGNSPRTAFSRLAKAIHGNAARATIIISCRVSDWRASEDHDDLRQLLGQPIEAAPSPSPRQLGHEEALYAPFLWSSGKPVDDNKDNPPAPSYELHVTALAPLTDGRARRLAEFDGVEDADAFMKAIGDAGAGDLVHRPLDLLDLARIWKDKRAWKDKQAVGSKHDILEWSIRYRLREKNVDRGPVDTLSESDAERGARLVAAALTFARRRFVGWPLDSPSETTDSLSIDPKDALGESWSSRKLHMLLNRAVFDPASRGRVRFHHRSVQELLCARWLLDLMHAGCPAGRIWDLLAEEKYGKTRLRPSMRPVTAWTGQLDERIRERLMAVAPEALIEEGDPGTLPLPARRRLLEEFARRHQSRDDAGISIDISQVRYFADPELAETIKKLWKRSRGSGELRELLLRIIWAGKLVECADIALEAATARGPWYPRALGARALGGMGTREQRRALADHLLTYARSFPKKAIAEALQAVFPSVLTLEELRAIVRKHPPDNLESLHSGLCYGLSEIAGSGDLTDPAGLVHLLYETVRTKPWIKGRFECSERYQSLLVPLTVHCASLVRCAGAAPLDDFAAEATGFIGRAGRVLGNYQLSEARKNLRDAVSGNTGVNRQLFWLTVDDRRRKHSDQNNPRIFTTFGDLWTIGTRDFDWSIADLVGKPLAADKQIAFDGAYAAWHEGGRDQENLLALRSAIAGNVELTKELSRRLEPPTPVEDPADREHERRMREIRAKREAEDRLQEEELQTFRDRLVTDPLSLKGTSGLSDLTCLSTWLMHKSWGAAHPQYNWQLVTAAFSAEVAEAARDGYAAAWRARGPVDDTEAADPASSTTPDPLSGSPILALIGLSVVAQRTPDFAMRMSDEDVERATRLAFRDKGSLPHWAPELWLARPRIVEPVFRDHILRQFARESSQNAPHFFLSFFSPLNQATEPFRSLAADWILGALEEHSPLSDYALSRALEVIVGAERDFSARLADLSRTRYGAKSSVSRRLMWLSVWLGVEAEPALEALNAWIGSLKIATERETLMVRLLNTMFEDRAYRFGERYRDFERLGSVIRLLQIVFEHVRREDDNVHEGEFKANARDRAEHARSSLLGVLCNKPGEATYRALIDLSNNAEHPPSRELFQVLADNRATADADLDPWQPAEIADFSKGFAQAPKTLGQLHDTVVDRLCDINDHARHGRFNNRIAWRQDDASRADEKIVQLGIAEQLLSRANGAYSVEREPEHGSSVKPDISVQRSGISGALPVEIKVADSWSYSQLLEAISDQLIGRYMKSCSSTHGILVITYHGKKKTWRPRTGQRAVGFADLPDALQREANDCAVSSPDIMQVSVIGIDLTD